MKYDFLIVGAGLFGAAFANTAVSYGKSCLVIDKRAHIAGNAYTENIDGIQVHKYGAHIFHTNDKFVWDYVNQFAEFNHYRNSPLANFEGKLYNLPFNMNTFYQLWGVETPSDALAVMEKQRHKISSPRNLEEQALALAGNDIYEKLIKGYTEKQWGRKCCELPPGIITRLPFRFTFDNNYFNDKYQGIPIGGYTKMVQRMLSSCEVCLDCEYFKFIRNNPKTAVQIVFTGAIDQFFNYELGVLGYRSLRFETRKRSEPNFQGNAVINYTSSEIPYTRIIEHKHFEFGASPTTILTYEYPAEWKPGLEPYYPINDEKNTTLYQKYMNIASKRDDVIFGGRLGMYEYMDMDKIIIAAIKLAKHHINGGRK